jgi:ribosomal protein S30
LILDFPARGSLVVRVSKTGRVRDETPDYLPPAQKRTRHPGASPG